MAHIHNLIDFVVSINVVYQDKVLMIDHKSLKRWLPIGGHVELDEDPEQAVYREAKEESGLDIEIIGTKPNFESPGTKFLIAPAYMDIHDIPPGNHKHIGLVYFARAKTDQVTLAPDEHHAIRWLSESDLDDPTYALSPSIIFFAMQAIQAAKIN